MVQSPPPSQPSHPSIRHSTPSMPSLPSYPSSSPSLPPSHPSYRQLGTASADRAVRVQMLISLVAGLVMVAVPLYLWRRPRAEAATLDEARKPAPAASASAQTLTALDNPTPVASAPTARVSGLLVSEPKMIRCSSGRSKVSPEQCDRQTVFEESLLRTLQENTACAPEKGVSGSINFVLDIDHKTKKLHAWAGKSGSMKRAQRKKIVSCISKALPSVDWAQVPHQHQKYQLSVLATYP